MYSNLFAIRTIFRIILISNWIDCLVEMQNYSILSLAFIVTEWNGLFETNLSGPFYFF